MDENVETEPLLNRTPEPTVFNNIISILIKHKKLVIVSVIVSSWILIGTFLLLCFLVFVPSNVPVPNQTIIRVLSLSVWGSPASFGVLDKQERMEAIGEYIRDHNDTLDVVILQELWMRPDHATILSYLHGTGLSMTSVGDLAPAVCDGRAAPTYCSGLALITRFPIIDTSFTSFSVHGDFWWWDGEYEARKGIGRVSVETSVNTTVEIFLTSLAANDYNSYYRQIQAAEFGTALRKSTADYVIAGANIEVDPRTSESSYKDIIKGMTDSRHEALGDENWLDSSIATYGNEKNTYSGRAGPLLYDYLLHKANKHRNMKITKYKVPILKTKKGNSFSNHEAVHCIYNLL